LLLALRSKDKWPDDELIVSAAITAVLPGKQTQQIMVMSLVPRISFLGYKSNLVFTWVGTGCPVPLRYNAGQFWGV